MSLVFCDSFDHYNTAGAGDKYFSFPGGASISAAGARTGIQCLVISGAFGPTISLNSLQSVVFGTAIKPDALDVTATGDLVRFIDGGTAQIRLGVKPDGSITVLSGNDPFPTTLATSAPGLIPVSTYTYVEAEIVIANVGSVVVRVNGSEVISFAGDTQATGNPFATSMQLMALGGTIWRHDDTYLLQMDGTAPNSFLGPVSVHACMPSSDSAPLNWTPSGGGGNFQQVNEVPQDLTDYNESATPGDIDQYLHNVSGIVAPQTVFAVQHVLLAGLNVAGAHEVDSCLDGIAAGNPVALTTSTRFALTPHNKKNGVSWTLANLATAKFGPELTS